MRIMRAPLSVTRAGRITRVALVACGLVALATRAARADDMSCPPGSVATHEGSASWCKPRVCDSDAQCGSDVCRLVPLCVEIGSLPGDAGQLVMVRQRCGLDKACPSGTSCSEMKRCLSRADADRLAPAAASTTPPGDAPAPAKRSCGCSVVGHERGARGAASLAGLALALALLRRRGGPW